MTLFFFNLNVNFLQNVISFFFTLKSKIIVTFMTLSFWDIIYSMKEIIKKKSCRKLSINRIQELTIKKTVYLSEIELWNGC